MHNGYTYVWSNLEQEIDDLSVVDVVSLLVGTLIYRRRCIKQSLQLTRLWCLIKWRNFKRRCW